MSINITKKDQGARAVSAHIKINQTQASSGLFRSSALQRQMAVTAYFSSKQLPSFAIARDCSELLCIFGGSFLPRIKQSGPHTALSHTEMPICTLSLAYHLLTVAVFFGLERAGIWFFCLQNGGLSVHQKEICTILSGFIYNWEPKRHGPKTGIEGIRGRNSACLFASDNNRIHFQILYLVGRGISIHREKISA